MASIDCAKYTSGQAGGLSVHFDEKERLEREHANPHIDKSKTHLNSFYDCTGYSDMLHKQKSRVAEADKDHPPERVRKDRITAIMMEIPVPKAISDKGLTDQFLQDTYTMIGEMVGKKNMCGMTIHRDEVHDYIDHGGKTRTSLEHGHAMVAPYARWTAKETVYGEDGRPLRDKNGKIVKQDVKREGVNAKHFLTRNFLKKLQDNMQAMVLEKYGISYQTSQEPLHMTVEDLKRDSARAAAIIDKAERQAEEARQTVQEAESTAKYLEGFIRDAKAEITALGAEKAAAEKEARAAELKTQELEGLLQSQEQSLDLIQSYEEYLQQAEITSGHLDLGERMMQRLPPPHGLFGQRHREEKSWLDDMKEMFNALLSVIGEGIRRLQIFEVRNGLKDRRSEPAQKRAAALNDMIAGAFARTEAASDRSQTKEKDEPSR